MRSANHLGLVLTLLLATALLAAGIGHRMPAPTDPALARFLAAGGGLQDICDHGAADTGQHCDSCRLVTPTLPPDPPMLARGITLAAAAPFHPPRAQTPGRPPRDPALGGRAPPPSTI